jgi:hypothetical protein
MESTTSSHNQRLCLSILCPLSAIDWLREIEMPVVGALLLLARTGFEAISLELNDHTDRGVGGRQYGTSEDIETIQG